MKNKSVIGFPIFAVHCADEATGDQAYLNGFIDGCMPVEGNTRGMCDSSTDGQK